MNGPILDNGGRRIGNDRRQSSFQFHFPERRSGTDRRVLADRRSERYKLTADPESRKNIFK